jgi:hypothetical protein
LDHISDHGRIAVDLGYKTLSKTLDATGDWNTYQTISLGSVNLNESGPIHIVVRSVIMHGRAVMGLRRLQLTPK